MEFIRIDDLVDYYGKHKKENFSSKNLDSYVKEDSKKIQFLRLNHISFVAINRYRRK